MGSGQQSQQGQKSKVLVYHTFVWDSQEVQEILFCLVWFFKDGFWRVSQTNFLK